jgi:hypothetical protein
MREHSEIDRREQWRSYVLYAATILFAASAVWVGS